MPVGSTLPTTTPAESPFILRIDGRVHTGRSPVGDGVVQTRITETAESSPNQMTFAIEDASNAITFEGGEIVELVDRRTGDNRLLFGGHLVEWEVETEDRQVGRIWRCTAVGFEAWLDWRIVPSFTSRDHPTRNIRIHRDQLMVQTLVRRFGGGHLSATDTYIENTDETMDVIALRGVTLREALERVAETATWAADEPTRHFYEDNAGRVHYYVGSEGLTAPYRIADGHYSRDVITTAGLVSYWPIRVVDAGTTEADAMAYAHGTYNGSVTTETTKAGIPNEPQHWVPWRFDGSDAYISATGANLHPGDTFTVEFWVRRHTTGSAQTVWSGGTDDVEIGFTSTDKLVVYKEGTGNHFVSDTSYTSTTDFIHVMVTREPGDTDVYVNGAAIAGTTTARTFSAGSGTINIGRRKSSTDRYYSGHIASVAVYSTKKSAAVALAHYNQGWSVTPERLSATRSAFDGREAVYVRGPSGAKNKAGTGWFRDASLVRTRFGRAQQFERQEFIDRDDSESLTKRQRYGRAFLRGRRDPLTGVTFTVVGFDGWRVGQTVVFTSASAGLSGESQEIKQIDTDVGWGAGVLTYEVTCGRVRWSGSRRVARGGGRKR